MCELNGGIVRHARKELSMTRKAFGVHLAEITGRNKPYTPQMIYTWEKGIKTPRPNIRDACSSVSATACVSKIEKAINKELTKKEKETITRLIISHLS